MFFIVTQTSVSSKIISDIAILILNGDSSLLQII